jgi:hypothetical protein
VIVELVAIGGAAAAAAYGWARWARWARRQRAARTRREHERFAHYVHPEVDEQRIGVTLEPAGRPPATEPVVTVDEAFTLQLGAGRRLRIPAGARLAVREFAGAHRRVLEHITTPHGAVARVSFDVPRAVSFWLLDAPSWAQLRATPDGVRGLRGVGPWEITTRAQPIARDDADTATQVAMHQLVGPAWLYGLDGADAWLAPPADDAREVAVLALSDPSAPADYTPRDDVVAGTMPCIAAALWLATGARVRLITPYIPGRGRLVSRKRDPWHADELAEIQRGSAALIHGAAEPDGGATVTVRIGGAASDRTITAPTAALVDELAGVLAARRLVVAATPLPGRRAAGVLPRDLDGHVRVMADLVQLILMSPQVRAIPRRAIGAAAVQTAARLAAAEPDCLPARLAWIATALAAHAQDELADADRAAVLDAVDAAAGPEDALYLLAPRILHGLGRTDAARASRDARRTTIGAGSYRDADGYARWLDRVA